MSLRGALLTQGLGFGELGNAAVSNLLTQRSPAGLTCHHSVPLRSSLGNAAPPCEDCCSRRPILRSTFLHSRGSWQRGSASLTSLGSWQRQPWSRRLSSPQAREGHHDTTECEDRSPDFFWAGNRAPFIFFRLRLYQGTSCADGSENHCLVNKR